MRNAHNLILESITILVVLFKFLLTYLKFNRKTTTNTLPNLWSDVEHESINVCATTDKHESTIFDL